MKIKFNVIKIKMSDEEKRNHYWEYGVSDFPTEQELDDFVKNYPDIYHEYVNMKCLKCDYEENMDADILFECFSPRYDDYPCFYCPNCNKDKLVPKDVYLFFKNSSSKK